MENKKTQKQWFDEIIKMAKGDTNVDVAGVIAFAEGRIVALDKKSENRKPSKAQVEQDSALMARIEAVLANTDDSLTATEILSALGDASLSNQKVSAILKKMVAEGTVVKEMDKKKALWSLA